MSLIEVTNPIEGALGPFHFDGAPVAGTSAVQTLTFASTWQAGDTFQLGFNGETTDDIAWSATNSTLVSNIDTAIEALDGVGSSDVTTAVGTMTSGIGTITVTFAGTLAKAPQSDMTVEENTSAAGTLANATTTPGVSPTFVGSVKGAILSDTTNGVLYINTGTATIPVWTKVGTQS